MAFINNTAFEVSNSNSVNNQMQQIPGKFGTYTENTYAAQDCSSGFLCTRAALIPSEGYEGITVNGQPILNGNTWYMVAAANGNVAGLTGDETGIYAFDSYNVNQVGSGANRWNIGFNTLGLGLPAGERGTFRQILVNEIYRFGVGNFTAAPSEGQIYATIADGKWTPTNIAPAAGTGVYAKILRQKPFVEGNTDAFAGYYLQIFRTAPAAG